MSYLSEDFPIHIGNWTAACCNIVISTPRLITFLKNLKKKKKNNFARLHFVLASSLYFHKI